MLMSFLPMTGFAGDRPAFHPINKYPDDAGEIKVLVQNHAFIPPAVLLPDLNRAPRLRPG
jgi:hypothetical protein